MKLSEMVKGVAGLSDDAKAMLVTAIELLEKQRDDAGRACEAAMQTAQLVAEERDAARADLDTVFADRDELKVQVTELQAQVDAARAHEAQDKDPVSRSAEGMTGAD